MGVKCFSHGAILKAPSYIFSLLREKPARCGTGPRRSSSSVFVRCGEVIAWFPSFPSDWQVSSRLVSTRSPSHLWETFWTWSHHSLLSYELVCAPHTMFSVDTVWVCVSVHHQVQLLQRPERPQAPGAAVTGGCEPPLQPQTTFSSRTSQRCSHGSQ